MNDWVVRLIEQSGYLGVGFLMFLETVFPPIPSEIIMTVAGVTAANGKLDLMMVILSGTAGAMLGNIFWYLAARALGIQRLRPFIQKYGKWLTLTWRDIERAHDWMDRRGALFVMVGRVIPSIRSLVSVPAGLLDMRFKSFVIASTIGTFAWTALLAGAGFQLKSSFEQVDQFITPFANTVLVTMVLVYLWRLATHKGS
ncbi:DedA family protein [Sphingomonas sabuli]|uniref:DedA family protein n=1 Tax=Sphingomonas sabuli TaxID=2764186 RepID=A0A7G9L292_9SPHN|nr:DedA family protein [Sphingomonas sabuli]QNM82741.1 DedA family protein [Sphingomonas sabuli]